MNRQQNKDAEVKEGGNGVGHKASMDLPPLEAYVMWWMVLLISTHSRVLHHLCLHLGLRFIIQIHNNVLQD